MNQEIKAQWVQALRSGEYEQGTENLVTIDGGTKRYCCLGVLCDLAVKTGVIAEPTPYVGDYENDDLDGTFMVYRDGLRGQTAFLPHDVQTWAGVDNGTIPLEYQHETWNADFLNDVKKLNFNELADLIDAQL